MSAFIARSANSLQQIPKPPILMQEELANKATQVTGNLTVSGTPITGLVRVRPDLGLYRHQIARILDLPCSTCWLGRANMPIAKDGSDAVAHAGKIYSLGGRDTLSDQDFFFQSEPSLCFCFDTSANAWEVLPEMRFPHAGNAVAQGDPGKIYSFGGYLRLGPNYQQGDYALYDECWSHDEGISKISQVFNAGTRKWGQIPDMPNSRVFHRAEIIDDIIYVIGGVAIGLDLSTWQIRTDISSSIMRYSVKNNEWIGTWPGYLSMQKARYSFASVSSKDGKIYVFGGLGDNCSVLQDVECFDPGLGAWTSRSPLPEPRWATSAVCSSDGSIYVLGGLSASDEFMSSVLKYDPYSDVWEPLPEARLPRRCISSAVAIDEYDQIYVCGGLGCADDGESLELLSSTWMGTPS